MNEPRLDLACGGVLTPVRAGDKAACLAHLADQSIHDATLLIPFPYTARHFDEWFAERIRERLRQEKETTFAIRESTGALMGVISLRIGPAPHTQHRAEIGYWLGKAFWRRGILTDAVGRITRYAIAELGLTRIYAEVFPGNTASIRVLEKNEFVREGLLKKHVSKNGEFRDAAIFGFTKPDA